MKSFISIFKTKGFMIAMMIGFFITSLLIVLAMLLGNEAGNFVIQVESGDKDKSISITDNEEDIVFTNKLVTPGMTGMACTTPRLFLGDRNQEQSIAGSCSTLGRNNDLQDRYSVYLYTFDIVNTGTGPLNMEISMNISNVERRVDEAIRIMTYNPSDANETIHVYQKRDADNTIYQYYPRTPEYFNDSTAFTQSAYISANTDGAGFERLRYSVFFWIEGYDPEATEEIIANGTIKFTLNISVTN